MKFRMHLPEVTLCCVDTRDPELALYALRRSMQQASFGKVLLLGSGFGGGFNDGEIQCIDISPLKSVDEYSRFMLKGLNKYITTPFVLIAQWDGYVAHPEMWRDDFLSYDYIGAPWCRKNGEMRVGNGGFSLRSKRLLEALDVLTPPDEPEDVAICVSMRQELEQRFGITFAPVSVAQEFAIEYGPYRPAFGFHGMHLFAREMASDELREWLSRATPPILASKHARKLLKELMVVQAWSGALDLLARRRRVSGLSLDHLALYLRLALRWIMTR